MSCIGLIFTLASILNTFFHYVSKAEAQHAKNSVTLDSSLERIQNNINLLAELGNKAREIHDKMKAVYGDESPSYDMAVRWKRNFQSGHMSLTDEPRAGRPSIKDYLTMVKKVEAVILDDRRSTMERVMAETGLSYGTTWRIIHEELHMNEVFARWKAKVQKSAGKVMLFAFWDSCGIILTDYLLKGEALNSNYYCNLLEKLHDALKQKWHGMISKGSRLLANNAPVHMAQAPVVTTHRLGYELLQHLILR
ncbi:hypothetical protein JRQ81_001695 [Phrynocephalus forsythii]|uniref:Transposase n=1 Tax=Phrynocephalus forsythii TaxID=171643 RepID=A0A9Q0Y7Q1_9SAUR|nr:hypothetical protein JRQ81_001695 [Phrynocephalus forsythii]